MPKYRDKSSRFPTKKQVRHQAREIEQGLRAYCRQVETDYGDLGVKASFKPEEVDRAVKESLRSTKKKRFRLR